jgi:XTP/dITP diphosphohydrolase
MSLRALVATRSGHKLGEIRRILGPDSCLEVVSLDDLGIEESMEEDALEQFDSFAENALAKARFFAQRTAILTIADDSGICVDALDGAPGVRSKRFANRPELSGGALDGENNRRLLELLHDVPDGDRSAFYMCAAAAVFPNGRERVEQGRCDGRILRAPRGSGGFGYDPLFLVAGFDATFGELPPETKNQVSHRARAFRALERIVCTAQD